MVKPDACIDEATKTNNAVLVRLTTFRHSGMFYRNRKALKGEVTVHLDLTKPRLDLLMKKKSKYVKNISNIDFSYSDINCRLKVRFNNRREEILIYQFQKFIACKDTIGNC